jgi:hypothetical protein
MIEDILKIDEEINNLYLYRKKHIGYFDGNTETWNCADCGHCSSCNYSSWYDEYEDDEGDENAVAREIAWDAFQDEYEAIEHRKEELTEIISSKLEVLYEQRKTLFSTSTPSQWIEYNLANHKRKLLQPDPDHV